MTIVPLPAFCPRVKLDPEALLIVSAPESVIVLAPKVSVPTKVPLVNVPTPALVILVVPFKERSPVVIATLPEETRSPPEVIVSPPDATVNAFDAVISPLEVNVPAPDKLAPEAVNAVVPFGAIITFPVPAAPRVRV